MTTKPPNVAFCRELRVGSRGNDVEAHKRAVSRAFPTLYPWWEKGFSDYYGDKFKDAVKGVQLVFKQPQTGIINKAFHEKLETKHAKNKPEQWAFDHYSIWLADVYCTNHKALTVREKIVQAGFFWYAHRYDIAYDMSRPFRLCKPPQVPNRWDCSGYFINCHYAGGSKVFTYNGGGYTGTILGAGTKCKFSELEPGDAIMYGFASGNVPGFPKGSPTHVAMYTGGGNVLSNGHYPMGFYEYNYRTDLNCYVHFNI